MRESSSTASAPRALLPAPIVESVLEDIPGGEPNLLPAAALNQLVPVEILPWPNSSPAPDAPETLVLFLDGDELERRTWTAAIPPDELMFSVSFKQVASGEHSLSYTVLRGSGLFPSQIKTVTVDKEAPTLNGDSQLRFPDEILIGGVTADYLAANGDELTAELPAYSEPRPGDVISLTWSRSLVSEEPAGSKTLKAEDLGAPIVVGFPGSLIRERGDGVRHIGYTVADRAGNLSQDAGKVALQVTAMSQPRKLPWPNVPDATGYGETLTLDPLRASYGLTVRIPEEADIRPTDKLELQWAEPGSIGSFTAPGWPGNREYKIPATSIAAHILKTVPVYYELRDAEGKTHRSEQRLLSLIRIPPERFPIIQCQEQYGGTISLANVPEAGATLKLRHWVLISTDQRVTIKVQGLTVSGAPTSYTVLQAHAVTTQELTQGIGANGDVRIPKSVLAGMKRDFPLSVNVYVSFDQGQTWPPVPNFPVLRPTLTD